MKTIRRSAWKKIVGCLVVAMLVSLPLSAFAMTSVDLSNIRLFGGGDSEDFSDGFETADGGFVCVGETTSTDGDLAGVPAFTTMDAMAVRFDAAGAIQWAVRAGGSSTEWFRSVAETTDHGFVAVGMTNSNTDDLAGQHIGETDGLVARFTELGAKTFVMAVGGTSYDYFDSVCMTDDGGFVAAGYTRSGDIGYGTTKLGDADDYDMLLVKFESDGDVSWVRQFGGMYYDIIRGVIESSTGDLYVVGSTDSKNGIFTDPGHGVPSDAAILKFSATGTFQWMDQVGGSSVDGFMGLAEDADGNILALGTTNSNDFDVAGLNAGTQDILVAKYAPDGALIWLDALGGAGYDNGEGISAADDGGSVLFCNSTSVDGDVAVTAGKAHEAVVLKIDADGQPVWYDSIGGSQGDFFEQGIVISPTQVAGFGYTYSDDGDMDGLLNGGQDAFLATFSVGEPPVDNVPPELFLTPSTTAPTDQDVTITVLAKDNVGIKQITLPDLSVYAGIETFYPVSTNGTYTFIAEDTNGNTVTQSITISNIDKTPKPLVSAVAPASTSIASGVTQLTVVVTTQNTAAGATVHLQLLNASLQPLVPAAAGTGTVGADGRATIVLTLPADLLPGAYFLAANVADSAMVNYATGLTVVAAPIPDTGAAAALAPVAAGALLLAAAGILVAGRRRKDAQR